MAKTKKPSLLDIFAKETTRQRRVDKRVRALVDARDAQGNTPLHWVSRKGWIPVTRALIEANADINARNEQGRTPLYMATHGDYYDVQPTAWFLIEAGAELDVNGEGRTLLLDASRRNKLGAANNLIRIGVNPEGLVDRKSLFIQAIKAGNLELMQTLRETGLTLEGVATPGQKEGFLHLAVSTGDVAIVQYLLEQNQRADQLDHNGNTPLIWSLGAKRSEISRLLIAHGANVDHSDQHGETPLSLSIRNNDLETFLFLLENGANINQRIKGATLLHLAALSNDVTFTRSLLERGLAVDSVDQNNNTPLIWALGAKKSEPAQLLIRNGANVNYFDNNGQTPLSLAIRNDDNETVILMLENDVDLNQKIHGQNFSDLVRTKGKTSMGHLLYYFPKLYKTTTLESLKILKENILIDIEEVRKNNSRINEVPTLIWLKMGIDEKAQGIYYLETEQQAEQKMLARGDHKGKFQLNESECMICMNPLSESPERPRTGPAGCSCPICEECSIRFTKEQVKESGGGMSCCPHCKEPTRPSFIRMLGFDETETRLIVLRQLEKYRSNQDGWAACRTPNCNGGEAFGPSQLHHSTCIFCDFSGCLDCGRTHRGESCQGANQICSPEELEEFKKPDAQIRPCYWCATKTLRTEGCNGMTCEICLKTWHWNYGDHLKHPRFREQRNGNNEVHDDFQEPMMYEPSKRI